jgi:conjugative transfer region protein TrbK
MRALSVIASLVAVASLSACDRQQAAKTQSAAMSSSNLDAELERCKQLGLKVYEDAACQAAQKEDRARFLGSSKEPVK